MKKATLGLAALFALLMGTASAQTTVMATGGNITVTPLQHASVQIEHASKVGMSH